MLNTLDSAVLSTSKRLPLLKPRKSGFLRNSSEDVFFEEDSYSYYDDPNYGQPQSLEEEIAMLEKTARLEKEAESVVQPDDVHPDAHLHAVARPVEELAVLLEQKTREFFEKAAAQSGSHRVLFAVDPGVGKTTTVGKEVVRLLNEGVIDCEDKLVWLSPSHALTEQTYNDLYKYLGFRDHFREEIVHFKGRQQPGMCCNLEAVELLQRAKLSASDRLCNPPRDNRPKAEREAYPLKIKPKAACPFAEKCQYLSQIERAKEASVVLMTHASLSHDRPTFLEKSKYLVIDENFTNIGDNIRSFPALEFFEDEFTDAKAAFEAGEALSPPRFPKIAPLPNHQLFDQEHPLFKEFELVQFDAHLSAWNRLKSPHTRAVEAREDDAALAAEPVLFDTLFPVPDGVEDDGVGVFSHEGLVSVLRQYKPKSVAEAAQISRTMRSAVTSYVFGSAYKLSQRQFAARYENFVEKTGDPCLILSPENSYGGVIETFLRECVKPLKCALKQTMHYTLSRKDLMKSSLTLEVVQYERQAHELMYNKYVADFDDAVKAHDRAKITSSLELLRQHGRAVGILKELEVAFLYEPEELKEDSDDFIDPLCPPDPNAPKPKPVEQDFFPGLTVKFSRMPVVKAVEEEVEENGELVKRKALIEREKLSIVFTLNRYRPVKGGWLKPSVLMLDGTPNEPKLRKSFPDVKIERFVATQPGVTIINYVAPKRPEKKKEEDEDEEKPWRCGYGKVYQTRIVENDLALNGLGGEPIPPLPEKKKGKRGSSFRAGASLSSVLELILDLALQYPGKKGIVFGNKVMIEHIRRRIEQGIVTLPPNIYFEHWGGFVGKNGYQDARWAIAFGRPLISGDLAVSIAEGISGKPASTERGADGRVVLNFNEHTGYSHTSHAVTEQLQYVIHSMLVQALGRGRGVRRSADDKFLFVNVCEFNVGTGPLAIPGVTDVRFKPMPRPHPVLTTAVFAGPVVDNSVTVSKLFPAMWQSPDAYRMARLPNRSDPLPPLELIAKCYGGELVTLSLSGPGRRSRAGEAVLLGTDIEKQRLKKTGALISTKKEKRAGLRGAKVGDAKAFADVSSEKVKKKFEEQLASVDALKCNKPFKGGNISLKGLVTLNDNEKLLTPAQAVAEAVAPAKPQAPSVKKARTLTSAEKEAANAADPRWLMQKLGGYEHTGPSSYRTAEGWRGECCSSTGRWKHWRGAAISPLDNIAVLREVFSYSFYDAVIMLSGADTYVPPAARPKKAPAPAKPAVERKHFKVAPVHSYKNCVSYLASRHITQETIDRAMKDDVLRFAFKGKDAKGERIVAYAYNSDIPRGTKADGQLVAARGQFRVVYQENGIWKSCDKRNLPGRSSKPAAVSFRGTRSDTLIIAEGMITAMKIWQDLNYEVTVWSAGGIAFIGSCGETVSEFLPDYRRVLIAGELEKTEERQKATDEALAKAVERISAVPGVLSCEVVYPDRPEADLFAQEKDFGSQDICSADEIKRAFAVAFTRLPPLPVPAEAEEGQNGASSLLDEDGINQEARAKLRAEHSYYSVRGWLFAEGHIEKTENMPGHERAAYYRALGYIAEDYVKPADD